MRRFLPAGGGGGEPSSSSSSGGQHQHQRGGLAGERAAAGLRYRGGDISLGHGHGHDDGDGHRHHLGSGGDADRQNDGSMDMLARHSSSPVGFFSNLVVDNGERSSHNTVLRLRFNRPHQFPLAIIGGMCFFPPQIGPLS